MALPGSLIVQNPVVLHPVINAAPGYSQLDWTPSYHAGGIIVPQQLPPKPANLKDIVWNDIANRKSTIDRSECLITVLRNIKAGNRLPLYVQFPDPAPGTLSNGQNGQLFYVPRHIPYRDLTFQAVNSVPNPATQVLPVGFHATMDATVFGSLTFTAIETMISDLFDFTRWHLDEFHIDTAAVSSPAFTQARANSK